MSQKNEPIQTIHEDEISLVDLVKTLINRKWWFVGTFIAVMILVSGIAYNKMAEETYNWVYTSYLSIGYSSSNSLIEPPEAVALLIDEVYTNKLGNKYSINIEYDNKANNILKIKTPAFAEQDEAIAQYHKALLMQVVDRHKDIMENAFRSKPSDADMHLYMVSTTSIIELA